MIRPLTLLVLLAACATAPGPESTAAELAIGTPPCFGLAAAVHLGAGIFVTAAHAVDGLQPMPTGCDNTALPLAVAFGGESRQAALLRAGIGQVEPGVGLRYFGGRDLALLRADGLAGPAAVPCAVDAVAGAPALLATPGRRLLTRIIGRAEESPPAFGSFLELPVQLARGESGAGVFDPASACLLGIVSHREGVAGAARTRLVPASVLRRFLAG